MTDEEVGREGGGGVDGINFSRLLTYKGIYSEIALT